MNSVILLGRLAKDPEERKTDSGKTVTSFTVAVRRETGDSADFIDCVAWQSTGEFVAQYFRKGDMIAVKGRLQLRDWTDKEGNKRRNAEVLAERVYFGGNKKQQAAEDGELPF